MNNKTRKAIEAHIEKIITEFKFSQRKEKYPTECPCYINDKPCHDLDETEFNCFLCFCPEYDNSTSEGGCKSPERGNGEWFNHESHETGRIWDCSNCSYPNQEETVREYLRGVFGLVNKED